MDGPLSFVHRALASVLNDLQFLSLVAHNPVAIAVRTDAAAAASGTVVPHRVLAATKLRKVSGTLAGDRAAAVAAPVAVFGNVTEIAAPLRLLARGLVPESHARGGKAVQVVVAHLRSGQGKVTGHLTAVDLGPMGVPRRIAVVMLRVFLAVLMG